MEVGGFHRVGKEQSGPCVSRTLSVWSEVLWALGVAKILRFRWNKMGCWKNEASLFLSYCLADLLSLWISVSCSVLRSVSSFNCISECVFFFLWRDSQVGRRERRLGNLNGKRNSLLADISKLVLFKTFFLLYICSYTHFISVHRWRLEAAVAFQTVTLLVLYTPWCSHYEGHLLSPSGPCECLKVLILLIQQSIQQAFVLERFVPLVLTNKIMHSTKGYMPHFIDCSQKYFHSSKSWQGKIQTRKKICTTTSSEEKLKRQALS